MINQILLQMAQINKFCLKAKQLQEFDKKLLQLSQHQTVLEKEPITFMEKQIITQQGQSSAMIQEQKVQTVNQAKIQCKKLQTNPNDHKYRCKKCRKLLFTEIVHSETDCTSVFINQPSWLNVDDLDNQIKFNCPKCKSKLGEVIFSGKKCSCGKWVTPAYQVLKNKVDLFKNLGMP